MKYRIFFQHLGKVGGMTLRHILAEQFDEGEICPVMHQRELPEADLSGLDRYRLFMGHLPYGFGELLPPDTKRVTMLRDPVARTVSALKHILRSENHPLRRHGIEDGMSPLEALELSSIRSYMANRQTLAVGEAVPGRPGPLEAKGRADQKVLDRAMDRVENAYAFVGLTGRYPESVELLGRMFGWNTAEQVPRLNAAPRIPNAGEIEPKLLALVEEINDADVRLYECACQRFESDLRKYGIA